MLCSVLKTVLLSLVGFEVPWHCALFCLGAGVYLLGNKVYFAPWLTHGLALTLKKNPCSFIVFSFTFRLLRRRYEYNFSNQVRMLKQSRVTPVSFPKPSLRLDREEQGLWERDWFELSQTETSHSFLIGKLLAKRSLSYFINNAKQQE